MKYPYLHLKKRVFMKYKQLLNFKMALHTHLMEL